jgi:hypothetical protein
VAKEKFDALLKGLERLGLGADDGDVVHGPQPTRNAVLMLVTSALFI